MTRSERTLRVNREREQRMVANALKWQPPEDEIEREIRIAQGRMEAYRVANAERLAKEGR
jgi:hypothetical protein